MVDSCGGLYGGRSAGRPTVRPSHRASPWRQQPTCPCCRHQLQLRHRRRRVQLGPTSGRGRSPANGSCYEKLNTVESRLFAPQPLWSMTDITYLPSSPCGQEVPTPPPSEFDYSELLLPYYIHEIELIVLLSNRRVATCKPGKPGLTSFSETLALFFIQFLSFRKMKVQGRQNGPSGLPENTGWLRACQI